MEVIHRTKTAILKDLLRSSTFSIFRAPFSRGNKLRGCYCLIWKTVNIVSYRWSHFEYWQCSCTCLSVSFSSALAFPFQANIVSTRINTSLARFGLHSFICRHPSLSGCHYRFQCVRVSTCVFVCVQVDRCLYMRTI